MSLIILPRQLASRAEFYIQLHRLTDAGIGLVRALEMVRRNPPSRSFREPVHRIIEHLTLGGTFTESLGKIGRWLPVFDVALMRAGEQSGRLDAVFLLLAEHYEDRARMTRQWISDLMYPVMVFHFAVFILPFVEFFTSGDLMAYLKSTFGVLLPVYGFGALALLASQGRHGERWRGWVESALRFVPILGSARRDLSLARLAAALEALIGAGVGIYEAWTLAAEACGSPALRRGIARWQPRFLAGRTPAEEIDGNPLFPETFAHLYSTGEVTGTLDDALRRLHQYYRTEGRRKMQAVAQWTPRIVFLAVALMIAYQVIQFYSNYFQQIRSIGGF